MVNFNSTIQIIDFTKEIVTTAIRIGSLLKLFSGDLLPKNGELSLMFFMFSEDLLL